MAMLQTKAPHHLPVSQRGLIVKKKKKNLLAATNYIPLARGIITGPHLAGRWTGKCSLYSRWLCAHLMKHNYWVASNSLCQCCLPFSVSVPGDIQDSEVSYITLYQPRSLEAASVVCLLEMKAVEKCWCRRSFGGGVSYRGLFYAIFVGNMSKVTQWAR